MKRNKILTIILGFLMYGCGEPVPLDLSEIPNHTNKIVANVVLDNENSIRFLLSNSAQAYLDDSITILPGASVKMVKDGSSVNVSRNNFDGFFEAPGVTPQAGETFQIGVEAPTYTPVNTSFVMPNEVDFTTALIPNGGIDESGDPSDLLRLTINDNGGEENFYRLKFYYYDEFLSEYVITTYLSTDAILASNATPVTLDGGVLFSDESFNGKSRTFEVVPPFGLVFSNTDEKYQIVVESVSKDLYEYLVSLSNYRDQQESGDGPFSNAVVIHTNINNGLGVGGGITIQRSILR